MKTTIVIPDDLHHQLKLRAVMEQTDVSSLLCRLAEEYLKRLPKKEWAGGFPVELSGIKRKKGGK